MAITRLMHMKEALDYKPQHLINAINYVLDVKNNGRKTEYGQWVGGNAGLHSNEIIQAFLDTKELWEKEDGRQGYHFVISFSPEEAVDAKTCYEVLQDFCEEYLADSYDYMFAVHTDQEHMHGHIIFNSVNRETGYKYHYVKGDWEKYIQPVTDKICKKYKLKELTYEKERVGLSYASWAAEKSGAINWTHIIRADVDYAIQNSSNMEEFFQFMKDMNYHLDIGYSRKYQSSYITFIFTDAEGMEHRRRSYKLIPGEKERDAYSVTAIENMIHNKDEFIPYHQKLSENLSQKVSTRIGNCSTILKGSRTYQRMYQAVSYYKLPNPFAVSQQQVRRDMLRIERLIEECAYLNRNPGISMERLQKRSAEVDARLKELYIERKMLLKVEADMKLTVSPDVIERHSQLLHQLSAVKEYDAVSESAEDELERLESKLPYAFVINSRQLHRCEQNIEVLKKEKRVLGRVIETEGGYNKSLNVDVHVSPAHK